MTTQIQLEYRTPPNAQTAQQEQAGTVAAAEPGWGRPAAGTTLKQGPTRSAFYPSPPPALASLEAQAREAEEENASARRQVAQLEEEAAALREDTAELKTKLRTIEENIARMRTLREEIMSSISEGTSQLKRLSGTGLD